MKKHQYSLQTSSKTITRLPLINQAKTNKEQEENHSPVAVT